MAATDPVERITPDQFAPGDPTPGMIREQAVSVPGMWAGLVRTAAGAASGWHHHGDCETTIYVVSGTVRMEFGPGGGQVVLAHQGEFLYVPKGAIHRESNPGRKESRLVVIRAGPGPAVVNVEGPAQAPLL